MTFFTGPYRLHDMEANTIVAKDGRTVALIQGQSFDEDQNQRHAREFLKARNCHEKLYDALSALLNELDGEAFAQVGTATAEILFCKAQAARQALNEARES